MNLLLKIRDLFWEYPDYLTHFRQFYRHSRPFSHIAATIIFFLIIALFANYNVSALLRADTSTLIEGVLVGQDEDGEIQKVQFLNPLIITNIQLKRDIAELVYEPLLRVNQENEVKPVLVENYADVGEGKVYRFKLKEGVKWHDGRELTTDDVKATFQILQSLEAKRETSSVFSKAAAKIDISVVDDYRFEFSIKDRNSVIPNFFEVISFKILPAHLIGDITNSNISYADPYLNSHPVGTGPFVAGALNLTTVQLERNPDYHGNKARLERIQFRLYKDQGLAVDDLKNGQIHSLLGLNSDNVQELSVVPNLDIYNSNVLYNQYWALYFNLGEDGKDYLKDIKVRQAIESSINKKFVVEALVGSAVEAKGPIPETSFAYKNVTGFDYDPAGARALLEKQGWVIPPGGVYREKEGKILEMDMVYVKNVDRDKVVTVIERDLKAVGVKVNTIGKTIAEVNNDHLLPGFFDMLLYGVSTFIDPDRYELFHSSQIGYPNLNIASYASKEETTVIVERDNKRVPEVDYLLDRGRSFIKENDRTAQYARFQEIIAAEVPVVFLYHPVYTYITNSRLKGIRLNEMTTWEDRFHTIDEWHIEIND